MTATSTSFARAGAAVVLCAALCAGCTAPPAPPAPPQAATAHTAAAPAPPAPPARGALAPSAPASAPASAPDAALAQLHALDTRRPVPLQPMMAWHQKQNMMAHLVAIERITDALAREDWGAVAAASREIGSSPEMAQMCAHMGAGADGFTDLALEFHRRADAIGAAARAEDAPGVLRATAHTLQACTQCHATYRQDVVDAETWRARTGQAHDPASQPRSAPAASAPHAAPASAASSTDASAAP